MNEVLLGLMKQANSTPFLLFSGLAEMSSTDRTYPKNATLCWKKQALLWFNFFNQKSFSLLNVISMWFNISSTLAVKMHIFTEVQQQGDKLLVP